MESNETTAMTGAQLSLLHTRMRTRAQQNCGINTQAGLLAICASPCSQQTSLTPAATSKPIHVSLSVHSHYFGASHLAYYLMTDSQPLALCDPPMAVPVLIQSFKMSSVLSLQATGL